MKLLLLSASDLRQALPMPEAIQAMQAAYAELSTGRAEVPLRTALPVPPDAVSLFMPARLESGGLGAKIVSVFPGNTALGKPVIHGLVVVLDPATGEPLALCDGAFLTAWRTGAASGAATALLARPEARVGAVFGCGVQGRTQALAIDAARDLEVIYACDSDPARRQAFVDEMGPQLRARLAAAPDPASAVRQADVICTATTSRTPVFDGALLQPGAHLNGIGSYTLQMQEVDSTAVGRARIFVDARAGALAEAGDLMTAAAEGKTRPEDWTELGEVAAGLKPGRQSAQEITFFKSVGNAVQDMAAASRALSRARELGLGQTVSL